MEAFTASLDLDPKLLRGLRHALGAWLDGSGAPLAQRNSVVLATHEATAHVMQTSESGGTVDVTASRDGDNSFVVHVRSDGAWARATSDGEGSALSVVAELMGDVSTQASHTLRMRTPRTALT